jgi:AraC-like DNA-binding protein
VRKRNLPGSPLPPSTEGRVTRLAAQRARGSCDLDALLREAGLTPAELEDSHARIEVRKQLRFLALAADELRDDLLGFHLAQSFEPRELGLLYYVHASSATLGEALSRVARYSSVAHEGLTMRCDRGGVKLEIAYVGVPRHVDRHQMEWLVTVLIRICRELTRTSVCPVRVAFAHPRCAASQALEQTLAHAVEFGCDRDLLEFSAAASSLPLASANPYLNECLVRYWEDALAGRARRQHSMRAAVENVVLPLLPHGNARAGRVAEALGLSTRTLTRRLAAEGVTFAEVLDEMRAELALRYLADPTLSVSHIAWLLGFKEASAFTHAFRRWTGKTPSEQRAAGSTGGAPLDPEPA